MKMSQKIAMLLWKGSMRNKTTRLKPKVQNASQIDRYNLIWCRRKWQKNLLSIVIDRNHAVQFLHQAKHQMNIHHALHQVIHHHHLKAFIGPVLENVDGHNHIYALSILVHESIGAQNIAVDLMQSRHILNNADILVLIFVTSAGIVQKQSVLKAQMANHWSYTRLQKVYFKY